ARRRAGTRGGAWRPERDRPGAWSDVGPLRGARAYLRATVGGAVPKRVGGRQSFRVVGRGRHRLAGAARRALAAPPRSRHPTGVASVDALRPAAARRAGDAARQSPVPRAHLLSLAAASGPGC